MRRSRAARPSVRCRVTAALVGCPGGLGRFATEALAICSGVARVGVAREGGVTEAGESGGGRRGLDRAMARGSHT